MKDLTKAQATTLRTIAANGGEMDGYAGQKGFFTLSLPVLVRKGYLVSLGTTRTADDSRFVTYNRHAMTDKARAALGRKVANPVHAGARAEGRRLGMSEEAIERMIQVQNF